MPTDRAPILIALTLAVVATAAPRNACGQNALGAGDVLDANSMVGVMGRNSVGDRFVDTRVRNLLVTGNVPAGREFRSSVGYTAPRDFRGATGADDNFAWRADSALSAGSLTRFGAQYDAMRFGGGMDRGTFRRAYTMTDLPDTQGQDVETHRTQANAIRLDAFTSAAAISSSTRLESQPQVVGILSDQPGRGTNALIVEASPLRGLQTLEGSQQRRAMAGLSVYDRLRLEEDISRGLDTQLPGDPFRTSFDTATLTEDFVLRDRGESPDETAADTRRLETINEGVRRDTRVAEADEETAYQDVLVRIAERYAKTQNITWNLQPRLMEYLGDDYEALRRRLAGSNNVVEDPDAAAAEATPPATPDPDAQQQMEDNLRRLLPSRRDTGADPDAEEPVPPTRKELELLGSVLRHGQKIDRLVSEQDQGRFEQLVRSAEERLADGEYFWAERRFRRALRFIPGHPLATAGLGHAQLGAGLYRSAAMTLRKLVTSQPEMIDVRYADALLPARVRLVTCVEEIRERLQIPDQELLSGFLLAYIGHQTEDAALVSEGLDAMTAADPDDELVTLLREVWGE